MVSLISLFIENKKLEVNLERPTEGEAGWEGAEWEEVGGVFLLRTRCETVGDTGLVLASLRTGRDTRGQGPGGAPTRVAGDLAGQGRLAGLAGASFCTS